MSEQDTGAPADETALDVDTGADAGADAPQVSDLEQFAIDQGWKPEDQYSGPEGKWKPAREWLAAEKDINRSLVKDVRKLRDQLDRMASASSRQIERSLREQAESIQQRFDAAVESGDKAGASKAAKDMRELERTADDPKVSGNPEEDFAKRNAWYGKDEDATAYAISVSQREAAKGKSHEEQLEAVEEAVRKRFPELSQDPSPRRQQPAVAAPTRTSGQARTKTFTDLPPEAKSAAEQMAQQAKQRYGKDPDEFKKQYAKDYFANAA